MIKRGLILGLLGFILSFGTAYFLSDKKDYRTFTEGKVDYRESVSGWISVGEVLSNKISESVALEDDIFISILMEEFLNRISTNIEINITNQEGKILWATDSNKIGDDYRGWSISGNNVDYEIRNNATMVGIPIKYEGNGVGNLYLSVENNDDPNSIALSGWQNYISLLSYAIREEVSSKNNQAIDRISGDLNNKKDLINFTVVSNDNIILIDKDERKVGERLENGWIKNVKDESNDKNRVYLSEEVNFQNSEVGNIHLYFSLPSYRAGDKGLPIPGNLLTFKGLIPPIAGFIIFFVIGLIMGGSTATGDRVSSEEKEELAGFIDSKETLEEEIRSLKKDQERLESKREELTSEIAEKQKVKKDLEKEIESLEEIQESMPEEITEDITSSVSTGNEEERTGEEESLLFDDLFDEKGSKSERSKEELELTQRIVAKRREEIALSARVEAKRKELIELERKIDNMKNKLEGEE